MLLSRLEISGFKSFPEKTTLDFNGGITGVVGPNGCGKSNILDSIRWVLGEQRTSMLRSSRMEEIIFNGTSQLKPTGMAEVNLTIKNNRGILPIEYNDIVITRRLFRSGESEYFLNKNRCRLKDIMELFYDTGMGPHAYSVIQQGMVDSILSDKTEDRRSLFEEAAGVTKYKHRKKDAENKLEAAEADLLRLGDVISEIEKQVVSLRRQAKRALRYSSRKDDLKTVEIAAAAGQLHQSERQFETLLLNKKNLKLEVDSSIIELDKSEANLQEMKLRLSELDSDASRVRQAESSLTVKAAEIESDIKLNKQKSESAEREIANNREEIEALENRILTLKQNIEEKRNRLIEIDGEKSSSLSECQAIENSLADISGKLTEAETELEEKRRARSKVSENISGLKAESLSLNRMRDDLQRKLNDIRQNTAGFDKFKNESGDDIRNLENSRAALISRNEELRNSLSGKETEISKLSQAVSELKDRLAMDKEELSGLKARQELLDQLIESGEGYSSGARALMSWPEKPPGMLMPVAEVLEVPEKYRIAVNAALGEMGEIIPVRQYSDAETAIEYLKSASGGRASFIVLEKLKNIKPESSRPQGVSGLLGYLNDIVSCPDEYRDIVDLLLSRVAMFDSKESALNSSEGFEYHTRVTPDGLVLLPSGMIAGGKTAAGLLGRRQDLGAVENRITEISSRVDGFEKELSADLDNFARLKNESGEIEKTLKNLDDEKNRIDSDLSQQKFDFREKENRYSSALGEADKLIAEIESYDQKLSGLSLNLASLENELKNGSDDLDQASAAVDQLRKSARDIESGLTKARIRNVELDGLTARFNSEIEHARQLCEEAEKMIVAKKDAIASARGLIDRALAQNEEAKKELEDCFGRRKEVKEQLLKIEGSINEIMSETKRIENELSKGRKLKELQMANLHNLDMELVELESSRKSIGERLRMEFHISSVEPKPFEEGRTLDSMREEAELIREELRRMEPVNLMAAEDYERENDRLNFLTRQREDLLEAKSSLKEAITRINTTAVERFNDTFVKIEENFQKVFMTLFESGEARVELEDPSNPLESPIKISARPGGKKMLAVTQLSGGERALTAISLLFSIYLVKPSPFCILDEVDAPLDDANLLRFLKLIKNFSENTQFIIITHNKLTMEASDILYGVTMENPGVSKVVSVKFAGNGNGGRDRE